MTHAGTWLRFLPCACALLGASGCSLMDLGDFGLTNCEHAEQCDALNQRDGLGAGDCVIWQCRKDKRGCEQRPRDLDGDDHADALSCRDEPGPLDCDDGDAANTPGKREKCDGQDNDCDGLVDEDVAPQSSQHAVGKVEAADFLSYAQDDTDALYLMLGASGSAEGWVLSGQDVSEHAVSYVLPADANPREGMSCARANAPDQPAACNFAELALAALGGRVVTAGVNTTSCGTGQLRVGLGDPRDFNVQLGSAARDSNLEWGVDIVEVADTFCTIVEGASGARSPRIAALEGDASQRAGQALALWLAAPASGACTGDAPLAAIALWPQGDARGQWLQGGNGGHAELLGLSAGCEAASIGALHAGADGGYAVAYPGRDGVELIWLPRPDAPSARLNDRARRASVPTAEPSHVALALLPGGRPSNGRGPLVAFRAGGAQGSAIGFAPIAWSAAGLAPGEPQTVQRGAPITAGPVAAYAREGFARAALDDGESHGGWLIVWAERAADGPALMALRVADVGGGTILGEPFALAASADPQLPFVCAAREGGFEYGFVARDGRGGDLTLGDLSCPASD